MGIFDIHDEIIPQTVPTRKLFEISEGKERCRQWKYVKQFLKYILGVSYAQKNKTDVHLKVYEWIGIT